MNDKVRAHLLLLLTVVVWSFAFMGIKELLEKLDFMVLNQARFAFTTLLYAPLLYFNRKRQPRVGWPELGMLQVLGILSIFGYFMALNYGETYMPSGITSLLVSTSPLFTLTFALFLLKERVRAVQIAGFLLSFGGLFVAVYLGTPYKPGGEKLLGVVLLLLGAVCWGGYTVGMKSLSPRLDPLQITGYSTVIGFLLTLPFLNAGTFTQLGTLSAWQWLWLAFLGLVCTGLGNFLYTYALARLEASRVAAYVYLVPVLGLIWGWLFLDESLNAWVILGAAGVICGLMLVEASKLLTRRGDRGLRTPNEQA